MKLTKTSFSTPAVTVGTRHYFPSANDLNDVVDGKVSMDVCYYDRSRKKWLSDIAYINEKEAKAIVAYAQKRGTLLDVPGGKLLN